MRMRKRKDVGFRAAYAFQNLIHIYFQSLSLSRNNMLHNTKLLNSSRLPEPMCHILCKFSIRRGDGLYTFNTISSLSFTALHYSSFAFTLLSWPNKNEPLGARKKRNNLFFVLFRFCCFGKGNLLKFLKI